MDILLCISARNIFRNGKKSREAWYSRVFEDLTMHFNTKSNTINNNINEFKKIHEIGVKSHKN